MGIKAAENVQICAIFSLVEGAAARTSFRTSYQSKDLSAGAVRSQELGADILKRDVEAERL